VREESFLEIKPDALNRVQFGRVGWQRDQSDVGWNGEGIRAMPACLIKHHHRMFVISDGFRKAVEEGLHCRRIGIGHHQCEGIVRARFNGSKDVGEGEALVANAAFLTDARLVLEDQAKALTFVRTLNVFQKRRSPF
jgi:hypothetical protein